MKCQCCSEPDGRDFLNGYCALCWTLCLPDLQVSGFELAALRLMQGVTHGHTRLLRADDLCPFTHRGEDGMRARRLLQESELLHEQFLNTVCNES